MDNMNVLIACEFSGIVRNAFAKRGHNAWSCDMLPSEKPGNHYQGNVLEMFDLPDYGGYIVGDFDLMIAHPPCTFLANSGVKHLYKNGKKENGEYPQRWRDMRKAARFFKQLLRLPVPRICLEKPIMHGYGKKIIGTDETQIIQPWQFGHGEIKATCLWLKDLPELKPSKIVSGRRPRVHHASPGPDRWKERSRTLQGVADAMAEQWG